MPIDPEQLAACLRTLAEIARLDPHDPRHVEVERAIAGLTKTAKRKRRAARRRVVRAADRATLDRAAAGDRQELDRAGAPDELGLIQARRCTVCKAPYRVVHAHYPHHCPACGDHDWSKRTQRVSLHGRRALVTGGRIKIGYQLALRLLRDGADVAITTRFPVDAHARFAGEPDAAEWLARLEILALHLGDVRGLLHWIELQRSRWPHLDILVNNAAQTVRRPLRYYAGWALAERALPGAADRALVRPDERALLAFYDRCLASDGDAAFPPDKLDEEGLPLDLRATNSWRLEADDVHPVELAEVMVVNTLAPFLLTTRLTDLLRRSPFPDRYVVHASAVEGQFEVRAKMPRHPHTNMAKAALNMFTRTSASSYASDGIYMTSVDTGWVTNENPHADRDDQRARGVRLPLDVHDGAARLFDPIAQGIAGMPVHGVLLKDYRPVPW